MHALTPVISLPSIDSVDSVIDFAPLTVTPDTLLFDVVTLMNQQQISCVLVTDQMRVVGWFTNQDLIKLVCCGFDFQTVQISQVMVTSVITLEYSQAKNLAYLLLFFRQNNLSLLPIVDPQNQLVGLITLNTIFQTLQILCSSLNQSTDITEQLRLFESVVVNVNDAIIITTADVLDEPFGPLIVYVNEAFTRMSGWTSADVIGKTPRFLQGDLTDHTQLKRIRAALINGSPVRVDLINYHKKGYTYWIDANIVPIANQEGKITHFVSIQRDITKHKQAKIELETKVKQRTQALQKSEERFRFLAESIPQQVWIARPDGSVEYINQRIQDYLGCDQEGMLDWKWQNWVHPEDLSKCFDAWQKSIITGEHLELEFRWRRVSDQTYRWHLSRAVPQRDQDGKILNWFATNTDIHDLKLAESELQQTQKILQAILDYSPAIISVLNTQNRYLLINSEYEKLFQITQEEVRGRSIYEFFPRDIADNFAVNNHNVFMSGTAIEVEEIIPQDNGLHTYLSIKFPLKDESDVPYAICSISTDITERKRTEENLRLRDRAIEASNNGIVISDARLPNMPIIYTNPAFEHMTGYCRDEVIGRNCSFLQGIDTNQPEIQEIRNAIKQARNCTVILRNYRRDNTLFWNELSISPVFDDDGKCTHYVGIQNDITERKQAEEELRTALEKEKELNELKSRFITTTSHEFRTPLTTILSSSELMEHYYHKWTQEKLLSHIRRIQSSVKHMTNMLNDVLVIGKAEAGRLDFKPISLDLVEYCRDLIQEFQHDDDTEDETENAIAFHCEYESMHCRVDKNLLGHILRNLLTNALKYSSNGSIIKFILTEQKNRIVFEIKDQGIGIPQEDLPLLFDSFHRAANVGNIPGTGLGLSIVKKCVDLHQGEIFVESHLGVGTTFTVILPLSNS
ncbi:MAG: histidine kinase [Hapalosiphonaceae cyanobacterium JJU2]|nr:MAG: histidine kinase [Hapalosiphonaceae cyanobacterium JJU2]